jgi:hypothetical protein
MCTYIRVQICIYEQINLCMHYKYDFLNILIYGLSLDFYMHICIYTYIHVYICDDDGDDDIY